MGSAAPAAPMVREITRRHFPAERVASARDLGGYLLRAGVHLHQMKVGAFPAFVLVWRRSQLCGDPDRCFYLRLNGST